MFTNLHKTRILRIGFFNYSISFDYSLTKDLKRYFIILILKTAMKNKIVLKKCENDVILGNF